MCIFKTDFLGIRLTASSIVFDFFFLEVLKTLSLCGIYGGIFLEQNYLFPIILLYIQTSMCSFSFGMF